MVEEEMRYQGILFHVTLRLTATRAENVSGSVPGQIP
jgi:hypothetical protein